MKALKFIMPSLLALTAVLFANEKEFGDDIDEWQTRLELARVMSYQKRYPEAIKQYYLVLKHQPDATHIQAELAEILAYAGHVEEATKILNQLAPKAASDQDMLRYANVYAILKQFGPSQSLYVAYLNKNPQDLHARFRYAEMLTWEKKYDEAIKQYELLLKERANDIQLRRKYALVLIWMGNADKGKEELEKTLMTDNQ